MFDLKEQSTAIRIHKGRKRGGRAHTHPLVVQLGVVEENSAHVGVELHHDSDVPEENRDSNVLHVEGDCCADV